MKKTFWLILGLFLGIIIIQPVGAKTILPQESSNRTNQYYSVVFDQEQEAAVVAKLTYLNRGKDDIKELALEIPGTTVRIISALQEKIEYNPCDLQTDSSTSPFRCGDVSYSLLDFDSSKLKVTGQSTIYTPTLKEAIASQKTGTIIIYYKAKGLSHKIWNGYKYSFETIKSPYDIDNVRVAVNVTDDLYIKDSAQGQTNYQANDIPMAASALSGLAFQESASMKRVSEDIQSSGGVIKETTSLDPGENYQVEGKYYNSSWMGELPTIIGVGVTFLVIVIVLLLIIKSEKKKI